MNFSYLHVLRVRVLQLGAGDYVRPHISMNDCNFLLPPMRYMLVLLADVHTLDLQGSGNACCMPPAC
jgi:hypothetical protein